MYAGAHGMSNDLDVVLDAARMLEKEKTIRFVFVGDGKEKPALETRAKDLRLNNVLFLPPVSKSEMPAMLAGADACIAILKRLDEYKTTYPNKVFDYMAAGKPIVLAIDGVIRDVVDSAYCGLFVEPGNARELADAVKELSNNKVEAKAMGLRGRNYLEAHFSRDAIASQLLSLLEDLTLR
jgi:glycosyltransferase involved in cell wall biosynthesis